MKRKIYQNLLMIAIKLMSNNIKYTLLPYSSIFLNMETKQMHPKTKERNISASLFLRSG